MKKCPKCGKAENEIDMETSGDAPKAWCPCGWGGLAADLVEEKKTTTKASKAEDAE